MKTLQINISLVFNESVNSDDDIEEIVTNVTDAIKIKVDDVGITPDGADYDILSIEGFEPFTGFRRIIYNRKHPE